MTVTPLKPTADTTPSSPHSPFAPSTPASPTQAPAEDPADIPAEVTASSPSPSPSKKTSAPSISLPSKEEVYKSVSKYAKADLTLALTWLLPTLFFYALTWWNAYFFMIPLAGLLRMRVFILFHDMAHNSFFPSATANNVVGTLMGTLVYTPLSFWKKGHNYHHKHSNNLDRKQYGQTAPWTTETFNKASFVQKCTYLFIYGQYSLFTIIPFIYFVILQRFFATIIENLLILAYVFGLYSLGSDYILFELGTTAIASSCGFLLFHIQHTFDGAYKQRGKNWDYFENALRGSSFFIVPSWLKYFTCGIEYHHIHHLNSLVPCYYLAECHEQNLQLFQSVNRVQWWQVKKYLSYSLFDEEKGIFQSVQLG